MADRPYVVSQAADPKDRAVRVEAAGHDTVERIVKFDQSRDIELSLKKTGAGGPRGPVGPTPPAKPDEPEIKVNKKPPSTQLDPGDPWK